MSDQNLSCDYCANYVYDEEDECYYCVVNMDEDDYYRLTQGSAHSKGCPYFSMDDEYRIVRKQM